MQMPDIVDLCTELGVRSEPGPQGVAFSWFDEPNQRRINYRIERGSGIAGRGGAWSVVALPSGPAQPKVTSRRELRRQILAVMAEGPRPENQPGTEVYARWHTYGTTSSVQWFRRRVRSTR